MAVMFPKNLSKSTVKIRNKELFYVNKANTERYKKSAIPFLQRKLNENSNYEKKQLKSLFVAGQLKCCHTWAMSPSTWDEYCVAQTR